jgi:hypothetical protein
MLTPLYLVAFFFFCAAGAYGIQKRKRWAWYGGWIFMFFAAAAIGTPLTYAAFSSRSTVPMILSLVGLTGAVLLWTGWAIWWSRRQHEFGIDPKA